MKKPFGQTKVGKLLKKVGSPALALIGNVVPGADILGNVLDMVLGDEKIDPTTKAELVEEIQQEIHIAEIEAKDRENARNREIEVLKSGGSNWLQYFAGVFALALFGFIAYVIVFRTLPEANAPLFHQLIGLIEGVVLSIFTYYFGTSKSSADKTKLLR